MKGLTRENLHLTYEI